MAGCRSEEAPEQRDGSATVRRYTRFSAPCAFSGGVVPGPRLSRRTRTVIILAFSDRGLCVMASSADRAAGPFSQTLSTAGMCVFSYYLCLQFGLVLMFQFEM